LNFWLPGSREGVTQQAGNGVGLVEMLKTFTRLKWINSDENKHGVAFIRDVLKGPSKHEYLLVTPSFPLTDKAFTRLMGLTHMQRTLQLACCVPNGVKAYSGNTPLEEIVQAGAPSLSPDKFWSEEALALASEIQFQLGTRNFVKVKLFSQVELHDTILWPAVAQTLDPYHIFSGALGWHLVFDKKSKTIRGIFPGAGESLPILDIANTHMGAVYWHLNTALFATILDRAPKLPLGTPEAITMAGKPWLEKNRMSGFRASLELADQAGAWMAVDPKEAQTSVTKTSVTKRSKE